MAKLRIGDEELTHSVGFMNTFSCQWRIKFRLNELEANRLSVNRNSIRERIRTRTWWQQELVVVVENFVTLKVVTRMFPP